MNRHTVREVRRQFRESGAAGVAAVMLVTVASTWGGALWSLYRWVSADLLAPRRSASVVAVVGEPARGEELVDAVKEAFPALGCVLARPETVRAQLAGWFPELATVLGALEEGSFPTLLELEASEEQQGPLTDWLKARPEVRLATSSQEWEARFQRASRSLFLGGFVLALALLLGCGVVVLLAVRLLVLAHADEITIMRLIGAYEREIRLPYLVCGGLLGTVGALIGFTFLVTGSVLVASRLAGFHLPTILAVALPGVGGLTGLVGAALGLAALPAEP